MVSVTFNHLKQQMVQALVALRICVALHRVTAGTTEQCIVISITKYTELHRKRLTHIFECLCYTF